MLTKADDVLRDLVGVVLSAWESKNRAPPIHAEKLKAERALDDAIWGLHQWMHLPPEDCGCLETWGGRYCPRMSCPRRAAADEA